MAAADLGSASVRGWRRRDGEFLQGVSLKLARDAGGGGRDRDGAVRGRRCRLCHYLADKGTDDGATVQERFDKAPAVASQKVHTRVDIVSRQQGAAKGKALATEGRHPPVLGKKSAAATAHPPIDQGDNLDPTAVGLCAPSEWCGLDDRTGLLRTAVLRALPPIGVRCAPLAAAVISDSKASQPVASP